MSKNISKLSGRKGLEDNLFERVKQPQANIGEVAERYLIGKSTVYGSQTFYEFLDDGHRDKQAWVCNGSSCLCSGNQGLVRSQLEASLAPDEIGSMTCLGHCYDADAFHFRGRNYSGGRSADIDQLVQKAVPDITAEELRSYSVTCTSQTAILTDGNFQTTNEYTEALQTLLDQSRSAVIETIKTSGLRGRGGAGFPAGVKWQSCMDVSAETKYIVCNADEGDPGAFSDRYLLEQQSLRVIFGMLVAAWLAEAKLGVIYIRAEYPESVAVTRQTIAALQAEKLLGENILNQGFSFDIKVIEGAGAYICGEETALIASIEGRRAEVDVRPPFPTEQGLFKQPTILNNVETFAAIQRVLELGGERFEAIGRGRSTGTKLLSLDAGFNRPGIVEVEMGMALTTLVEDVGGGFRQPTKAIHIGGPLGGLVPVAKLADLTIDFESFSEAGFLLGHASLVCIPESFALIRYLEHLFEFTRVESCGKCFPCRLGSTRGQEMLSQAINGKRLLKRSLLDDLLTTLQEGSLCALGGGLPLPVMNALQYFEAELSPYFESDDRIPVRSV